MEGRPGMPAAPASHAESGRVLQSVRLEDPGVTTDTLQGMPSSFADTYWAGGRLMTIAALNCPCCPVQGLQSDTKAPVPDLALQEPRLAHQHEMEIHKPSQPPGLPRFSIKRRMGPVSWSAVGCGSVANKQIGGVACLTEWETLRGPHEHSKAPSRTVSALPCKPPC